MGKYKIIISSEARKDIQVIEKSGDNASVKKLRQMFADLIEHPETGVGKPERLKYDYIGFWSRRINRKDRLIYSIENEIVTVTIVSALGHYNDK